LRVFRSYTHASDLPVGHDTFIARFDINSLPANCTREKLKVKMDLHGLISVVGAQAMEETKDDEAQSAAEAAAADAMEVEQVSVNAAQEAAQAAADEKKKRKYKKHEIGFGAQFAGGLSAEAVRAATEVEGAQSLQDRVIAETAEKRNELESFIYETRSALDAELQPFLKADAIAAFQKQLDAAESWLDEVRDQDTPVQKSDYVRKLAELKAVTDPAERRRGEQKNRAEAISALKSAATKYRLQAVSPDAKFAHIEANEKAKIVAAVDELESWLQGAVQKQDALNGTDEPVFTCAELNNKRLALSKLADPIMSKPVPAAPKPEAAPQPAPQAAPAADAAAAPAPETGMDLD
jgi:heat shock protein 4